MFVFFIDGIIAIKERCMEMKKRNLKRKLKSGEMGSISSLKRKIKQQEKSIFDLRQLLEISRSFCSMIEFNRLMESILYIVMAQMKTFGVAIFIQSSLDDDSFVLYENIYGFEVDNAHSYSIPENDEFISFLSLQNRCISPNELKHSFDTGFVQMILALEPTLIVPLKIKKHLVGFLLLGNQIDDVHNYDSTEQDMILDIANLAAIAINNARLLEMTTTDMMTHLKLKHYFFAVLNEKIEMLDHGASLALLMFDIDNFKQINDTYGHVCGDLVLQKVASIIKNSVRNTDLAARYGGEEFAAFISDADLETACKIAERIRLDVESMVVDYEGQTIRVTISIGIAEYLHSGETVKQFIQRSDAALYNSKRTGKNKYSISEKNVTRT